MSDAKRCDRCKDFYEPKEEEPRLSIIRGRCDIIYDLCPECQETLENWLKNKQGGSR